MYTNHPLMPDVNISKDQPSKSKGLGAVGGQRSKNAAFFKDIYRFWRFHNNKVAKKLRVSSYLRRLGRHGYDDMKGEVGSGRTGPVLSDAAEGAVVLDTGHGQVQLRLFHFRRRLRRGGAILWYVSASLQRLVPLDVKVVSEVDVIHQGRPVVDHRVFVHPDDTGVRHSLQNEIAKK